MSNKLYKNGKGIYRVGVEKECGLKWEFKILGGGFGLIYDVMVWFAAPLIPPTCKFRPLSNFLARFPCQILARNFSRLLNFAFSTKI